MNQINSTLCVACITALIAASCADPGLSASELNRNRRNEGGTSGTDPGTGGATPVTGGVGPTGGTGPTGGAAGSGAFGGSVAGGSGGSLPEAGATSTTGGTGDTGGVGMTGGSAGAGAAAGFGGVPLGGTGGGMAGGVGGGGAVGGTGAGAGGGGPYDPRSGTFKVLVYYRTVVFRHVDSINTGKTMVQQIATEQGFTVALTDQNTDITPSGLSQYEVLFFLNTTGDIFSDVEQQTFETWMTTKNGGFVGVHSATDTENGWSFYSEVTGQYFNGHVLCCSQGTIQWDPGAANHVAVRGLPNPWSRTEEWYHFNLSSAWSAKEGFQILARATIDNVSRPVSFTRQYRNFRSFYTSLGHQGSVFQDANVKRHVAAGIMWAARREHLLR
jgi:type 1 glutamine amidotransferase